MEYLAKDLQPGVTYAIQIRSVSGTDVSEWSPVINVVTTSDSTAPGNITGLTGTVVGNGFRLLWNPISTNADGTQIRDFKDYQISIDDGFGNVRLRYAQSPSFFYAYENNVADFGEARPALTFGVVARDTTNNISSTPAVRTLLNPIPANVPSLNATTQTGAVQLNWAAVADTDIQAYNLYVSDTSTFDPDASNRIFSGNALSFLYPTTATGSLYFLVTAVDIFGQESAAPTASNTAPTSYPVSDHDTHTFTYSGPLTLVTGEARLYFDAPYTFSSVRASVGTAPTGSSVKVDVLLNGTSIWATTPSNAPEIAVSTFTSGAVNVFDTLSIAAGDYLTIDVTQIGSTLPGEDLTVSIRVSAA